jgi:hypothetical protein
MRPLLPTLLAAALLTGPAAATTLELAPLVDLARGHYGYDQPTTVWSNLVTATLRDGPFAIEASSGWLHVEGPAAAGAQGVVGGGSTLARRRTGLADTVLGANWRDRIGEQVWLQLGVETKLPTADADRGLGTGSTDGTLRTRAAWLGAGRVMPFVEASFTMLGSADIAGLRDTAWSAGLGAAMRFDTGISAGLYGELRQPVTAGAAPVRSLLLFAEAPLTGALSLSAWAGIGSGLLAVEQRGGLRLTWRSDG